MAGFKPATSGVQTAVTADTYIMQDTNSADLNFARHGQFREKEKNAEYWIEYFPFEKNFSTENKIEYFPFEKISGRKIISLSKYKVLAVLSIHKQFVHYTVIIPLESRRSSSIISMTRCFYDSLSGLNNFAPLSVRYKCNFFLGLAIVFGLSNFPVCWVNWRSIKIFEIQNSD